MDTPKTKTEF